MVAVLLFALVGFILILCCPLKNKKTEDKSNKGNSTNLVGEMEIIFSNLSLYNSSQIKNGTQTSESETNSSCSVGLWTLFGFSCFIILFVIGIICGCNCRWLKKLFLIAFFYPLPISDDEVELIKVKFSAWEYAGCDTLWAGIITCLCDKLEERFGEYPSRYFRRIKDEYQKNVDLISQSRSKTCCMCGDDRICCCVPKSMYGYMRPYTCCCIPKYIWMLAAVPFFFPVVILPILFSLESLKHLFTAILSGTATVSFTVYVIKLLFFLSKSTKSYIEILQRKMSRPDFKEELGFMHLVKQEVELLNDLVEFMENFKRKRFRIVLLVDDLDRCENVKVLKMLEAISILLSEPNTRFISLIAVDPRVVVKSLELTVIKDFMKEDSRINGHEYLKKIIHLPIWLPEMEDDKVKELVRSYMPSEKNTSDQLETSNNQEGQRTSNNQEGQGTSNNQQGQGTSNNQQVQGTTNNQEGQGTSNNQQEQVTSNNQQVQGTTNNQEGQGTSNNQQVQGTTNNQEEQGTSNNQQGQGTSNNQQEQVTSNNQQGQGTSNNQQGQGTSNIQDVSQDDDIGLLDALELALDSIYKEPQHVCHNPRSIKRICNVLNLAIRLYTSKELRTTKTNIKRLVITK